MRGKRNEASAISSTPLDLLSSFLLFSFTNEPLTAMKVNVNQKSVETTSTTLAQLIAELQLPQAGVAVGINNRMVPRTEWESYALNEGLNIVIIKAACGG